MSLTMAGRRLHQTACLIFLLSGHMLVDCRRLAKIKNSQGLADANNHPWCNPFSSQQNKSYHFEIELTKNNCTDGFCLAIELFRHKSNPVLEIHGGKSWAVEDDIGTLSWSLFSKASRQNASSGPGHLKIDLLNDVESVKFFDATRDQPPKMDITMVEKKKKENHDLLASDLVFELEGGLYFNERLLKQGFDRMANAASTGTPSKNTLKQGQMTSDIFKKVEKNATNSNLTTRLAKMGLKAGALASLAVWSYILYSEYNPVAFPMNWHGLYNYAFVEAAGHIAVSSVLGGAVGGIIGLPFRASNRLADVMGGYSVVEGYEIVSASRKIFEKLRCLAEFKECSTNVLVPKQRPCPRT